MSEDMIDNLSAVKPPAGFCGYYWFGFGTLVSFAETYSELAVVGAGPVTIVETVLLQ